MAALRGVKTHQIENVIDEASQYDDFGTNHDNVHMGTSSVFVRSVGGGTGTYRHVDGDVPVSMHQSVTAAKTFKVSGQKTPSAAVHGVSINLLAKNVQSIMSDGREMDLLETIDDNDWDVIFLSETWRKEKEEIWKTTKGHLFLGAGWEKGHIGVAIMIHCKDARGFKKLQGGPCLEQTYTVKARPPREWPPGGRLREAVGPGRPQVGLWGQAGEGTTVFYGPHQDEDMNHSITDVQTNPF